MVRPHLFKLVWDIKALEHFKEILNYLGKKSPQAPKLVKNAIIARLELIISNPLICELDKLKESPNREFRAFVVFSYRVTYQVKTDTNEIRVLRIRHTSREPLNY